MALSGRVVVQSSVTYTAADGLAPTPIAIGETIVTTQCFIEFTVSVAGTPNRLGRHAWTAEFASTSTIQFKRGQSASAEDCVINYTVIELTGATVEHIEIDHVGTLTNNNITSDADRSILLAAIRSDDAITSTPLRTSVYLTKDASQSRLTINDQVGSGASGDTIVRAQIIQFALADINHFQRDITTLPSGSNGSATLSQSVDTTRTLLYVSASAASTSNFYQRGSPSAVFAAATTDTINFTRDTRATSYAVDVAWIVIEIPGLIVRHGGIDPGAATSGNETITAVNTARASTFSPRASVPGNVYADENTTAEEGMYSVRLQLTSSTNVAWARGTGTDLTAHDNRYQVVEWPEAAPPGGGSAGGNRLIMW